mmetsp:Transcript_86616/g.250141  ORF Transcript_86616/g.250141 Transcript_86616/m.250141 type:complete len:272 (-) Transcript_86616:1427-2242(-)
MPDLREEAVVDAGMAQVVRQRSDEKHVLLQLAEKGLGAHQRHQPADAMQAVHGMPEVVEGHRKVLVLDCGDEPLQRLHLRLGRAEALRGLPESGNRKDRQGGALRLREGQGVEGPRLVGAVWHPEVLQVDGRRRRLLSRRVDRPSRLRQGFLLVGDVLPLHHAEDAYVLVAHVRSRLGVLRRLQVRDDRQLLDNSLQQLHLVRDVYVRLLFVDIADLGAELEDRGRDLPDGAQHPLQGPDGELRDDAGKGEAAEDHDKEDEDDRHDAQPGL